MFNKNLVAPDVYHDFYKSLFYQEGDFYVVHPEYISHFYKQNKYPDCTQLKIILNNKSYFRFINLEVKYQGDRLTYLSNTTSRNFYIETSSIYMPFKFKNTLIRLWKF